MNKEFLMLEINTQIQSDFFKIIVMGAKAYIDEAISYLGDLDEYLKEETRRMFETVIQEEIPFFYNPN